MASKAITATTRAANKAARNERRGDIIKRWDRRKANRSCERLLPGKTGWSALELILYHAKWAPLEDLIEYVDPESVKGVLSTSLRVIELKEMTYDEYLQSPEWRIRAAFIKKRYEGRCALDNTHPGEHAHHRTYDRRGREHENDLIPLCSACHAKHHDRMPR